MIFPLIASSASTLDNDRNDTETTQLAAVAHASRRRGPRRVSFPLRAAGHCAWGGNCPSPGLVMAGVFIGAMSFISGLIALLIVAVRSVIVKPSR
jgi:hypothetical protein